MKIISKQLDRRKNGIMSIKLIKNQAINIIN